MTTKAQMIEIIRSENPEGLRKGNDEIGYTDLTPTEYEATITEWAENRLASEKKAQDIAEQRALKISAYQKLGLTETEIEALVPTPVIFTHNNPEATA